jgi:hypothetical protein
MAPRPGYKSIASDRVSKDRQIYLSIVAFGSVLWIVALISLAAPGFGTFLLTFVTLPVWVDKRLIRLAMTAAVVVIPALVGLVSLRMLEPGARPRGAAAKVATVMRGYPYTVGLAVTLVMMTVFAPVLKGRNLAREGDLDTAFAYEVPVALRALRHGHRGRRPPHPTRRAGSRNPLASLRPRDQWARARRHPDARGGPPTRCSRSPEAR